VDDFTPESDAFEDSLAANKIVLETLDDVYEYGNSVDTWVAMHESSEKEFIGSNTFGRYFLHVFDQPIDIVLKDGTVLETFQAAILVENPGELAVRDTFALTFPSETEARAQFEQIKEKFQEFWMDEEAKEEGIEETK
jgi:hypothetical protein